VRHVPSPGHSVSGPEAGSGSLRLRKGTSGRLIDDRELPGGFVFLSVEYGRAVDYGLIKSRSELGSRGIRKPGQNPGGCIVAFGRLLLPVLLPIRGRCPARLLTAGVLAADLVWGGAVTDIEQVSFERFLKMYTPFDFSKISVFASLPHSFVEYCKCKCDLVSYYFVRHDDIFIFCLAF
jgi:hypothetical protein